MEKIKKIKNAKVLSRKEQNLIKGGTCFCVTDDDCPGDYYCFIKICINK